MAMTLHLRQPITVVVDDHQHKVQLCDQGNVSVSLAFGSQHELKLWLVDLTTKILGYDRSLVVLPCELPPSQDTPDKPPRL